MSPTVVRWQATPLTRNDIPVTFTLSHTRQAAARRGGARATEQHARSSWREAGSPTLLDMMPCLGMLPRTLSLPDFPQLFAPWPATQHHLSS